MGTPSRSAFTPAHLQDDLLTCGHIIAWTLAFALIPVGLWLLWATARLVFNAPGRPAARELFGSPLLVFPTVLLIGLGLFLVLFLLRPWRRWLWGWLLSGLAAALVVFGLPALVVVLAFQWAGINPFSFASTREAQLLAQYFAFGLSPLGIPVGWHFWREERRVTSV